jgi:serine protease AprX
VAPFSRPEDDLKGLRTMRVRGTAALALIVILLATLSGGTLAQGAPRGQGGAPIRLKAATFDPSVGESARAPLELVRRGPPAEGPGYYIVQARGPVDQAWKDALAVVGVELLGYIPDNAFKVRMSAEQAAQLRQLGITSYVGLFHPFYVLSPRLAAAGQQLVTVQLEQGGSRAAVEATVAAAGATLVAAEGEQLIVAGDRSQIEGVAQAMDVAWIEPLVLNEKHNEYGGGAIIGGATANASGYDGSTQIAAVADTGIGGGAAASAHRDIPAAAVVAIQNFPGVTDSCFQQIVDDGAVDVDSGHGTHVAGSVLSRGDPGGFGRGVAPAARLVFQATENYVVTSNFCKTFYGYQNGYYLTGLNTLYSLYQQAYNAGARIHANSWGSSVAGDYTANSVTTDDFIWDFPQMTITFSAGNSGVDANANGVVDNDSIGSPATAKNVITIGASENDRAGNYQCDMGLTYTSADTTYQSGETCSSMDGNNLLGTPRERWGFTANPIADDPTAGNANQMAAFSSRGPTDDGRVKPDVVAPGTWILSTYSGQYQQGYDSGTNPRNNAFQVDGWGIPRNEYYKYFGGTSMSNPIAAGAATVVRDFYNKAYGANASAALVKATLINSAVDLLDENNDGANDNDFPIPNVHEGWGRINLVNATDGTAIYADNTAGLSTGGNFSATYSAAGGAPLKVTLVWSDYPSTASAAANLVNNLNLTVTGPGGVVYRGNVFSGGWSVSGGSADTLNNVENVYLQTAAAGSYSVQVSGANVPQGPQPFALVVRGAQAAPPPTPPAAPSGLSATAVSSSQINLSWADASNNEDGFTIERCQGAGCSSFGPIASVGAGVTSYSNTGLSASTSYSYRVRAFNTGGDSGYSNSASATTSGGAASTGLLGATANAAVTSSAGDNNGYESNPSNAHADDGLFAVDTNSGTGNQTSCTNNRKDKHVYRDYNVSLPGGATVNGIEVRLDARADATAGSPRICVQLSWNGGSSWTTAKVSPNLTTSEVSYILGGAADSWGRTWSSGELSNANFRVRVINVASTTSRDFSLDWVAVRVTYQ